MISKFLFVWELLKFGAEVILWLVLGWVFLIMGLGHGIWWG